MVGRVRRKLRAAGLRVVQSRDSDVFIPLEARPALARKYRNAIFVSIHFNAARRESAAGLEIFAIAPQGAPPTGQRQPEARDCQHENGHALEPVNLVLATTLYQTVLGKLSSFDRGVKRSRFAVLREATVPAVLIEGGFLTEPTEAARSPPPTGANSTLTRLRLAFGNTRGWQSGGFCHAGLRTMAGPPPPNSCRRISRWAPGPSFQGSPERA